MQSQLCGACSCPDEVAELNAKKHNPLSSIHVHDVSTMSMHSLSKLTKFMVPLSDSVYCCFFVNLLKSMQKLKILNERKIPRWRLINIKIKKARKAYAEKAVPVDEMWLSGAWRTNAPVSTANGGCWNGANI